MKNAVWVLVVLSGLFTACQTGKPYSGPATWGKYASPAEAQKTVSGTMEPETEAAEVSAAIELQKKEEPAYYAPEPVLFAAANSAQVTFVKQPKTTLSLSLKENIGVQLPEPQQIAQPRQLHKLAVAGLAASALAFLPFVTGISLLFGLPLALAGAFLSRRAIKQISADRETYRGLALAKAGFGIALVVLGLLLLFGVAALTVG